MTETKTENKFEDVQKEALDLMIKREEILASSSRKSLREARALNEGIFKAREKILEVEHKILKDAIAEGKVLSKTQVKKKAVMEGGKSAIQQGMGLTEGDKIFSGRGLANMLGKGLQGAMHVAGVATENPLFNLAANALGQRSSRIDAAREQVYQEDKLKETENTEETETQDTKIQETQETSQNDGEDGELRALAQTRNDILLKGFGMMPTSDQFSEFNDNLIDLTDTENDILENAEENTEDNKLKNDDIKKTETKPGTLAKVQKDNKKADEDDENDPGFLDNTADMLLGMNALKTMLATGPLITLLGVTGPIALAVAGIAAIFGGISWLESWGKGLEEDRDKAASKREIQAKTNALDKITEVTNSGDSIETQKETMTELISAKEKELEQAKDDAGIWKTADERAKIETKRIELETLKAGKKTIMTPEEKQADIKIKEKADQAEFERVYNIRKKIGYQEKGTEDYERRKKIKEDGENAKKPEEPIKTKPKDETPVVKEEPKAKPTKNKPTFAEKIKERQAKMEKEMDGVDYQEIPDDLKNQHEDDWSWAVGATDEEIAESERRAVGRKKIRDANAAITKKEDDAFYDKDDKWDDKDDDNWEDGPLSSAKKGKGKKTTKSTSSKKVTETVTGGKEHETVRSDKAYVPTTKNFGIDPVWGEKTIYAYDEKYGEKQKEDLYKSRPSRVDDEWSKIKDSDELKDASKKDRLRAKIEIIKRITKEDEKAVEAKRNKFLKNQEEHGGNYAYSEAAKEAEKTKLNNSTANTPIIIPAPQAPASAPMPRTTSGGWIGTSDDKNFGNRLLDNV